MSVGTDGVLLGAWAEAPQATTILDIGTGSGVIALMLAQRFPHAAITGIDINELAIEIARKNANSSPFKQNTEFINIDARSFVADKKFDLIVSNPPFFPTGSLESGTAKTAADFIDAERDYAGLTTLTGEADVSAAEAEAQRMVADYENDYTFHGTWNEIYVCRKKIC